MRAGVNLALEDLFSTLHGQRCDVVAQQVAGALDFLRGVDRLHAFYTENVRMLAHAYDLTDEEASELLANTGFTNVSVAILRGPRVDIMAAATGVPQDEKHDAGPAPSEDDAPDPDGDRPD